MTPILIYQLLVTLACAAMVAVAWSNLALGERDRRRARARPLPEPAPSISVCVPARNEAVNIEACVESLAGQRYPDFELLVLDDCSGDDTAGRAREAARRHPAVAIRVIDGRPLPEGWIGKNWACRQLADVAAGSLLLFTDADTVWSPGALAEAARLSIEFRADLLSGLPRLEARSVWERMSVPMLTLAGGTLVSLPLIAHPALKHYAAASGAFLMFNRRAYERIGGHGAVRGHIVEDVALARLVKASRLRLRLAITPDLVRCRMYRSLGEVWEGFTKNFVKAFPGAFAPLAILSILVLFVGPWASLAAGAVLGWGWPAGTALPLVQVATIYALRAVIDRRLGTFSWPAWALLPAAGAFAALIALSSWGRHLMRRPTPWRNRRYDLWRRRN